MEIKDQEHLFQHTYAIALTSCKSYRTKISHLMNHPWISFLALIKSQSLMRISDWPDHGFPTSYCVEGGSVNARN